MTARKANPKRTGRPSSYRPEYAVQAALLCQTGATDAELAGHFKVTTVTIWRWQAIHPDFFNALKRAKGAADERVERSLYARATGYTYEAVKIFMPAGAKKAVFAKYQEHVPPDTTAMIFWLKNRNQKDWRDRQEHAHSGPDGGPIQTADVSTPSRARALAAFLARTRSEK